MRAATSSPGSGGFLATPVSVARSGTGFWVARTVFCEQEGDDMWDFETEPEFQEKLDWADAFVREEVEPLDLLWHGLEFTPPDTTLKKILDPLKQQVRDQGLWATHL